MNFMDGGIDWAKAFVDNPIIDDIPDRVRQTQRGYRLWCAIGLLVTVCGLMTLSLAATVKLQLLGLFFAVDGMIVFALTVICALGRIYYYRILWDQQNRLKAELKKMDATDL